MAVNIHPQGEVIELQLGLCLSPDVKALSSNVPLRCIGSPRLSDVSQGRRELLSGWELGTNTYKRLHFPCLVFKLHLGPQSSCSPTPQPSSSTHGLPPSLGLW